MYVKFDFLSMIVVEEYVPLLPNILSQIVFVDEQIMYINWFNLYCQELINFRLLQFRWQNLYMIGLNVLKLQWNLACFYSASVHLSHLFSRFHNYH
jgi:hypothetical protein